MTRDSKWGTPIPQMDLNQDKVFNPPPVMEPERVKKFFTEFPLPECISFHQEIHHVLLHRIESEAKNHEESLAELNKLHQILKSLSE
jgi:hypothetical protein